MSDNVTPLPSQADAARVATTWPGYVRSVENAVIRANVAYWRASLGSLVPVRVAVMVSAIQEAVDATERRVR